MSEQDKANKDLIQYGQSFTVGGKHIPLDEVILSKSEQSITFEKFFPRPLAFADKAHELEMMSKWNDAKVTWETSLEAATAEANKRINALEGEVAELKAELKSEKEHSNILLKNGGEFYRNELALKAHINTLREALKLTLGVITGETLSKSFLTKALEKSKMALNATPAESLQAHDDLRKLCEKIYADLKHGTVSRDTMELLREALKEVK